MGGVCVCACAIQGGVSRQPDLQRPCGGAIMAGIALAGFPCSPACVYAVHRPLTVTVDSELPPVLSTGGFLL